jgi:hypothetical protein
MPRTGGEILTRLRAMLDDEGSSGNTNGVYRLNNFYTDELLYLCFNAAQLWFLNTVISRRLSRMYVDNLVATQSVGDGSTVASAYVHGVSAQIQIGSKFVPAQLYIGTVGVYYLNVKHKAVVILGNQIKIVGGSNGRLHYIKKPTPIAADTDESSWSDIANDIIINIAATMAGLRDTTLPRDIQRIKRTIPIVHALPDSLQNLRYADEATKPINQMQIRDRDRALRAVDRSAEEVV